MALSGVGVRLDLALTQQQQGAAQVGGIVGDGYLGTFLELADELLGVATNRIDKGVTDGDSLEAAIMIWLSR